METVIGIFSSMTLIDILDISIVSFLVYRLLIIFQGTRAVQMLIGIVALTALYWGSLTYEFYSLNFILNHFFESFFVITVIIFQDQIRTALVAFGEARFFGRNKSTRFGPIIEEVVAACSALSKEKTGALIVFERNLGLLNYTLTGTRLDCHVHSDLIYSLFQNRSSLHDGAVIIHEDRLLAAGCFLPLAKVIEIDRQYGTRHRAALGVTEVSDAVVIVVSEETGKISLCYEGFFYRVNEENDLRKNLLKILDSQSDIKNFGQRIRPT